MAQNEVQVGSGKQKRKVRWPFIAVLIATVVLATGVGAFIRWTVERTLQQDQSQGEDLPNSVIDARDLFNSGDYAAASSELEQSLADPGVSVDEKYLLHYNLGVSRAAEGDYQAAITAFESAKAIRETYEVVTKLGTHYQLVGDQQKAIEYYRRAIELNPRDNPTYESEQMTLEEMIRQLESGEAQ